MTNEPMAVVFHRDPEEFWQTAEPLLIADPVRNTVIITVLDRLRRGLRFSDDEPTLLTVHENGRPVGAAFRTPPYGLMVTALPIRCCRPVVDELLSAGHDLDSAGGARPEVEAFGAAWAERTGHRVAVTMRQRLYRLGDLVPPSDVPGMATEGTDADVPLLADWRGRFVVEASLDHHAETTAESERFVRESIASGDGHLLWRVDGTPVASASVYAPLHGMSRVGPVYTPPDQRRHGYGSAVTAAASRWARDHGATEVVLFTDLDNPTSNSIYHRIGYRPVEDALQVSFGQVRSGSHTAS